MSEPTSLGATRLLGTPKLGLLCSVRCPGSVILQTLDLARALRDSGLTVVGGFHSPMEQECLRVLLRGNGRVILCPARGLDGMRPRAEWQQPIARGQLLVLSPFAADERRVTRPLAERRNAFVAEVADALFVAYANPGGATERLAAAALAAGTPVFTFDSPDTRPLLTLGAHPTTPRDWQSPYAHPAIAPHLPAADPPPASAPTAPAADLGAYQQSSF